MFKKINLPFISFSLLLFYWSENEKTNFHFSKSKKAFILFHIKQKIPLKTKASPNNSTPLFFFFISKKKKNKKDISPLFKFLGLFSFSFLRNLIEILLFYLSEI